LSSFEVLGMLVPCSKIEPGAVMGVGSGIAGKNCKKKQQVKQK